MAEEWNSSCIEFLLRQPIYSHIVHAITIALPISSSQPPRFLKTLLLRRLAGQLPSLPPQTLDTIEHVEQIGRDHSLARSPSPAMQLAYSAVAVDLVARYLKVDGAELGEFYDAVNLVWNCRFGDLESSEARGLVSTRLRYERRLMEEAVANRDLRAELMGRETEEEAREAVMAYLKEAAEELCPTFPEMAAASVAARGGGAGCEVGRDEVRMPAGGNDASLEDGCSVTGFNRLPELDSIQEEPIDIENHDMVDEPPLNTLTTAPASGVPTLGIEDDPNLERMDEHQIPINRDHAPLVEKVAEVPDTRDIYGAGQNKDNHTVLQPSVIICNPTQSEHGEENQTTLGGHAKVSFGDQGQMAVNTEDTSNLTLKSKYNDTVLQPSVIDQNQTELEHEEGNHTTLGGNAKVSSVNKGEVAVNTEGTSNLSGKKRARHNVHGPRIMDRNPTARTYMWHDDSDASSTEKSPNTSEKFRVTRSKRRETPATNILIGRRTKKWWSADEEDTLRKAVDKFGAGNWSLIKSSYPAIFEDRTPVDLKDKWRNMTK